MTANQVNLIRTHHLPNQTTGTMKCNGFNLATIELGWNNNATRKSCIPVGTYQVIPRTSAKYGKHFHILNVPNRTLILIHAANFSRQLLGCVGVGLSHADIDKDGLTDVTSSKLAMSKLIAAYPIGFNLTIE